MDTIGSELQTFCTVVSCPSFCLICTDLPSKSHYGLEVDTRNVDIYIKHTSVSYPFLDKRNTQFL
jgi:hypothetical protein